MAKKPEPHIHTLSDGRGVREVFCDGEKIHGCFYADTRRGTVKFYGADPVVNKQRTGFVVHERCGRVVVNFSSVELTE